MRNTLPRRGLASLELVLSLPFLLAVAVIIASLAKVGLAKSSASIEARADAWRKRPAAAAAARPSLTPADLAPGTSTVVSGQGSKSVRLAPVLEPSTVKAESSHFVLAGTWDHQVLRPGAGQLQPDPLMAAFLLGGANPQELTAILGFLSENNIPAVAAMHDVLDSFRQVLNDLNQIREIVEGIVKALKPHSSSSGIGGLGGKIVDGLMGGASTAANFASVIPKITALWNATRNLTVHSAQLAQQLPKLVQAVGQLPQTRINGQSLPKGGNMQALLERQLQDYVRQQAMNALGAQMAPQAILDIIDKVTKAEQDLKRILEQFKKITNFIDDLGKGQLFRYANF